MSELKKKEENQATCDFDYQMAVEDSIDILNNHVQFLIVNEKLDIRTEEAFNQAVAALTRNIPQPLDCGHVEYYDNFKVVHDIVFFCPKCNIKFIWYDNVDFRLNYCSHCGQALDWRSI